LEVDKHENKNDIPIPDPNRQINKNKLEKLEKGKEIDNIDIDKIKAQLSENPKPSVQNQNIPQTLPD